MTKLTYDDDMLYLIIENITYRLDVHAEADYCYISGTMYRNNGDPGDPPDEELDIKTVVANWYLLDENEEEEKVDATEEMTEELYDYLYEMDIENWESEDEDYEESEDY